MHLLLSLPQCYTEFHTLFEGAKFSIMKLIVVYTHKFWNIVLLVAFSVNISRVLSYSIHFISIISHSRKIRKGTFGSRLHVMYIL